MISFICLAENTAYKTSLLFKKLVGHQPQVHNISNLIKIWLVSVSAMQYYFVLSKFLCLYRPTGIMELGPGTSVLLELFRFHPAIVSQYGRRNRNSSRSSTSGACTPRLHSKLHHGYAVVSLVGARNALFTCHCPIIFWVSFLFTSMVRRSTTTSIVEGFALSVFSWLFIIFG